MGLVEEECRLDPIASKACKQLKRCGCNLRNGVFKCTGLCGCRKSGQPCTELCKCKGACKWWVQNDTDNADNNELDSIEEEGEEEDVHDEEIEEQSQVESEDLEEYSS